MKTLVKSVVTVVAIKAGTLLALIAIGTVAEWYDKKQTVQDTEH